MSDENVVIILGAGATLEDAPRQTKSNRPPLDRGFFKGALKAYPQDLRVVSRYMQRHYRISLNDPSYDSLERVMAVLYTDMYGGGLEEEVFPALDALITVFLKRLAKTTNHIRMTSGSRLYRLIVWFLKRGVAPRNLTIVSFNQDIQAEKALDNIGRRGIRKGQSIFSFPHCYHLPSFPRITSNPRWPLFETGKPSPEGVALLKLHGSLNWYSSHDKQVLSRDRLFDRTRKISVTARKELDPEMRVKPGGGEGKRRFALPIVVPPVVHKSGILHQDLFPIWALAEERIREATRVVIFGYSCPQNDWESANLISRSLTSNRRAKEISVVDPDPGVVLRYVELGVLTRVSYYSSAHSYLRAD